MIEKVAIFVALKGVEYGGMAMIKSHKEKKALAEKLAKEDYIKKQCVNGFVGGIVESVSREVTFRLCMKYLK